MEFQGGGGFQKPCFLKESMRLKWNFQRGGRGVQTKKPSVGGVWIFSGTHSVFVISRIIKVSVKVFSLSLRLITITSTLIILDMAKTSSNDCL